MSLLIKKGDKVTAWGKGGVGEYGEVIDVLPKDKHGVTYYEIMLNDNRGKTYAKRNEITKEQFAAGGVITEESYKELLDKKEGEKWSDDMKVLYYWNHGRLSVTLFYNKYRIPLSTLLS